MTTCSETLTDTYDRLNTEIDQLLKDRAYIHNEIMRLNNDSDHIQNLIIQKSNERDSLKNVFNSLNQTTTDKENTEKHDEPSSNENKETAPRSETPLTINTVKSVPSWASMCETDSNASIATNENDDL